MPLGLFLASPQWQEASVQHITSNVLHSQPHVSIYTSEVKKGILSFIDWKPSWGIWMSYKDIIGLFLFSMWPGQHLSSFEHSFSVSLGTSPILTNFPVYVLSPFYLMCWSGGGGGSHGGHLLGHLLAWPWGCIAAASALEHWLGLRCKLLSIAPAIHILSFFFLYQFHPSIFTDCPFLLLLCIPY